MILLIWCLFGLIGLGLGIQRGLHPAVAFLGGMLLGPLSFLIGFVSSDKKKCPSCAEFVQKDAKICKHCKTALIG